MKYPFAMIPAAALLLNACAATNEQKPSSVNTESEERLINVIVSILPQVEFVERIGGERVNASEMIPPGFSPATYDPSPEQLRKLEDADLYFRIGHIPFEKSQMSRLQQVNRTMKIVDTSEGIGLLTLADHSHNEKHEEIHEDEHEHEEGDDPHIWLSPALVKIQANHIYEALVELRPEDEEYFTVNYERFRSDLDALDEKLQKAFAPMRGRNILVFHPAFGYLADRYGFHQKSIEIEGKEPTPAQLKEVIDEAREEDVKVVFVQAQFSTKSAETVAQEIGGAVVQIDPLAQDYFSNLESMADAIVRSIPAE